jgi:hypothetical protein
MLRVVRDNGSPPSSYESSAILLIECVPVFCAAFMVIHTRGRFVPARSAFVTGKAQAQVDILLAVDKNGIKTSCASESPARTAMQAPVTACNARLRFVHFFSGFILA